MTKRDNPVLTIGLSALRQLDAACLQTGDTPREVCGFLLGTMHGAAARVHQFVLCPNAADGDQARHYRIHREEFRRAERLAASLSLGIVGVFHSHPNGRAVASAADKELFFPGWYYLIIGVEAGQVTERNCFRGPLPEEPGEPSSVLIITIEQM